MMMIFSLLLAVLLFAGKVSSEDANVSLVLDVDSDSEVLGLDDKFQFTCWINTSSQDVNLYQIYLLIDNSTNSSKMDRIAVTNAPGSNIYVFNITEPSDNGTQFRCILAEISSSIPDASTDTIVLQVEYAPIFSKGNNETLYHYIRTHKNSSISCALSASNPPIDSFTITNTSHNVGNVHANYTSKVISFTDAISDNRGTYTCTASNPNGTTYLSYKTFIGGVPDNVDITVFPVLYTNDSLIISLGVTDNSDAPARTITVGVSGVQENVIDFTSEGYSLPVHNQEMIVLEIPLKTVYTSNYQLFIIAGNPFGDSNVHNQLLYIEGSKSVDVLFESPPNVTTGDDFTFSCSLDLNHISYPSFNLSILINGNSSGDYFNRLILGTSVANDYQIYTFVNTTYLDNGVKFTCVANGVYSSEQTSMNVYFPPIFDYDHMTVLKYFNTGQDSSIQCTVKYCNPSVDSLLVFNTSRDTSNIEVDVQLNDVMSTALINITNARVTNRGTYSCEAVNELGSTFVSYKTFIGGVPDNLTVDLMHKNIDSNIMIGLGLTDHSDAPACKLAVKLEGVGVYQLDLSPEDIPLDNSYDSVFMLQQDELFAGDYDISITGSNYIGSNNQLYRDTLYLEGTASLDVYIDSDQSVVIEGKLFTFTCSVNDDINGTMIHFKFDVLIDGKSNTTKHKRLHSTYIDEYTTNFTFAYPNYQDDGTTFNCRVNRYYTSDSNKMTVYYAPVIGVPAHFGGFLRQSLTVNITIQSKPSHYFVNWFKDGKPVPSSLVGKGNLSLIFNSLSVDNDGMYTIIATNGILNETRQSLKLSTYDGPYFDKGLSNSSILAENRDGSDFELTCSIKHADPAVVNLTFIPETGPNWHIKRKGVESVSLIFTNGKPQNNTRQFICVARNNLTTATLKYDNYIGDIPNNTVVKVYKHDNGSVVILSLNIIDMNSAPITKILYYVKGIDNDNKSLSIDPYSKNAIVFNTELSYQQLADIGATNFLFVYAHNLIGSSLVLQYNFTIPIQSSSKRGLSIGLGIGLPLVALVIIIVAVVGGVIFYRRKTRRNEYSVLANDGDGRGSINHGPNDYDSI